MGVGPRIAGALFVGVSGALGCAAEPPPPPIERPPAEVHGQRTTVLVGAAARPAFDDERPPRVRWPGADFSARWVVDGEAHALLAVGAPTDAGEHPLSPLSAIPPGPGALVLVPEVGAAHVEPAFWLPEAGDDDATAAGRAAAATADAIALNRGGQGDAAVDAMIDASAWWLLVDRPGDAVQTLGAAAHYARYRRRLADAAAIEGWSRALIDAVDDEVGRYASLYRSALLDIELGRFRAAEQALSASAEGLRSIGEARNAVMAERARANLLGRLGRHAEALAIHEGQRVESRRDDAFRARVNHAWVELQAMRAGAVPADYPSARRAFAAEVERLPDDLPPASRANLFANLALAGLLAGAVDDAQAALEAARAADPRGGLWPAFLDLIEGEVALARGRPVEARAAFGRAAQRAREEVGGGDSIEAWQALYGEGRAAMAQGDADAALERWRAALEMTRRLAGRTALTSSHSAFLADRRALVDDLVLALIERDAPGEAFRALDAARAPTLRALAADARLDGLDAAALAEWRRRVSAWSAARDAVGEAEADVELAPDSERAAAAARLEAARQAVQDRFDAAFDWLDAQAPLDGGDPGDPTALVPDGMALLSFSVIDGIWHGFLITSAAVRHRVMDGDDVIGPWGGALAGTRRIYVIDGGLPAARTLAERPVGAPDGALWGERVELVSLPYAGWLHTRAAGAAKGPPLVVADPDGTLPGSRRAAVAVARAAGIEPLVGEAATRARVLAALDGARWFHFDGHGVIGRGEPWQAHLRLAGGARLSLADVLAVRPTVGTVMLSGCETGAPEALSRAESLGLAEGFLLAGASRVVAADRVLGVEEAARFVDAFYRHGGADDPSGALRATIAELRAGGDDAWRGWRVFGVPPGG